MRTGRAYDENASRPGALTAAVPPRENALMKQVRFTLPLLLLAASACETSPETPPAHAPVPARSAGSSVEAGPATSVKKLDKVPRAEFNRLAAELALPLFWSQDKNANSALDPEELAVYWGLQPDATLAKYVGSSGFTPALLEAYAAIQKQPGAPAGNARQIAVKKELAQGRATLVETDLSKASAGDKKFVRAVMNASVTIEHLFAKQMGTASLAAKVPTEDLASKTLFFRAQGPKCGAPLTQDDPNCSAVADPPKGKMSGLYPGPFLTQPAFCDVLSKNKDPKVMNPFQVVGGTLDMPTATAYPQAFPEMGQVSTELRAAADALDDHEPDLKSYLLASAKAFGDNDWWPADEAWAKMNAKNSKYYIRIAPDEVYSEPCSTKALFHVSFGLINQGSLKWQSKLDPIKNDMEKALASLAGAPYSARKVRFALPDFVDIALNAGDSRTEFGATIGQSLPNFGPVANGGRGRTVAMTNFYTDPDSIQATKQTSASLLCRETMERYSTDQEPLLMSTVLHEAAHNLGPAHQYRAGGKTDREAFGGPLASTLEELKAQTAAMFFSDWLVDRKELGPVEAQKAHVRDVVWGFGHISRGMYDADKHPKNYSQLAAIQLGWFMNDGAIAWKADATAANEKDKGCISVDFAKLPVSVKALMTEVAQIKATGNKARAEKLVKDYVDVVGEKKNVLEVITERVTRAPKQSFVYSIKLD